MMTHYSKKPYECKFSGCDKSYCDARSLRRHLENHHQQLLGETGSLAAGSDSGNLTPASAPPDGAGTRFVFEFPHLQAATQGGCRSYLQSDSQTPGSPGSAVTGHSGSPGREMLSAGQIAVWPAGFNPFE